MVDRMRAKPGGRVRAQLFARHDPVHQRVTSQRVVAGPDGMQLFPVG
jgi:hypothetical protein